MMPVPSGSRSSCRTGGGLRDIEQPKQQKRQDRMRPVRRNRDQRDQLPRDLVDHNMPRIVPPRLPRHNRSRRNPDQRQPESRQPSCQPPGAPDETHAPPNTRAPPPLPTHRSPAPASSAQPQRTYPTSHAHVVRCFGKLVSASCFWWAMNLERCSTLFRRVKGTASAVP